MTRFLVKIAFYGFLILIVLELLVRIFHLNNDLPKRFVDADNMNKWIPGQTGYAVYGNRVQNKAAYRINESGFNSYREFLPTDEKKELALIGDSFIEGFHQDFDKSIGKKIESELQEVEVYEYGHASNDFADQLYLTSYHKEHFSKVDYLIYYLRYSEDLNRSEYKHVVRKPMFLSLRKSKLLEYSINIGLMDPIKESLGYVKGLITNGFVSPQENLPKKDSPKNSEQKRRVNFDTLLDKYEFNKQKSVILLDSRVTPESFLIHLETLGINTIDFAPTFIKAGGSRKTTLIYDQHWNDFGRSLISSLIVEYLKEANLRDTKELEEY